MNGQENGAKYGIRRRPDGFPSRQGDNIGVKQFYDQVGWNLSETGVYEDAKRWEDLRACAREYIHDCHLRLNRFLPESGRFLLDAASGPVQYPEYLTYSRAFQKRICLDFSFVALQEARRRLSDSAFYVVGDCTQLPFGRDSIDAVISLHTLYHIHKDRQQQALSEFLRVTKPNGVDIIVYSWGDHDLLDRFLLSPVRLKRQLTSSIKWPFRLIRRLAFPPRPRMQPPPEPESYFFAHDHGWFEELGMSLEIHPWRSLSVEVTRTLIHGRIGAKLLRAVYWLEERYPRMLGTAGAYATIVIRKR